MSSARGQPQRLFSSRARKGVFLIAWRTSLSFSPSDSHFLLFEKSERKIFRVADPRQLRAVSAAAQHAASARSVSVHRPVVGSFIYLSLFTLGA